MYYAVIPEKAGETIVLKSRYTYEHEVICGKENSSDRTAASFSEYVPVPTARDTGVSVTYMEGDVVIAWARRNYERSFARTV